MQEQTDVGDDPVGLGQRSANGGDALENGNGDEGDLCTRVEAQRVDDATVERGSGGGAVDVVTLDVPSLPTQCERDRAADQAETDDVCSARRCGRVSHGDRSYRWRLAAGSPQRPTP